MTRNGARVSRKQVAAHLALDYPGCGWCMDFNDAQRQVIEHGDGPLVVTAVAGAGKTRTLISRIAALVRTRNVEPQHILATTFTVKAASEMASRLRAINIPVADGRTTGVTVGTVHSVALQILKAEMADLDRYKVDGDGRLYKDILRAIRRDHRSVELRTLETWISRMKALRLDPAEAQLQARGRDRILAKLYAAAEEERASRNILTFDDMLLQCARLLEDPAIRARQAPWVYVLQDEVQDENLVQRHILRALAHRGNYMVVGDPMQTIYSFRGSCSTAMQDFVRDYPSAEQVSMQVNYRSGARILDVANRVGAGVVKLEPASPVDNSVVLFQGYATPRCEAEGVVDQVARLLQSGAFQPSDVCILSRTHNQVAFFEEELSHRQIPYLSATTGSLYRRREVAAMLSYLRLIAGDGTSEDLVATFFTPPRMVKKTVITDLAASLDRRKPLHKALLDAALARGLGGYVLRQVRGWCDDYAQICAAHHGTPGSAMDAVEAAVQLTRAVQLESDHMDVRDVMRDLRSRAEGFETIQAFLHECVRRQQMIEGRNRRASNAVVLSTVHAAKGLEWPCVFVAGLSHDLFPHVFSTASPEDMAEERRLLYVAVTRARDVLVCSYAKEPSEYWSLVCGS